MSFDPKKTPCLFHGTDQPFEGTPRPGGYDGVFWTAEQSTIAQSYISESGGRMRLRISAYQLHDKVRPDQNSLAYSIALMFSKPAHDIKYDRLGTATSYQTTEPLPSLLDIAKYVQEQLGYENASRYNSYFEFDIKTNGWDPQTTCYGVVPATHRNEGNLLIVGGFSDMRFYDISRGESDLTDLQYHKIATFRRLESEGYDGVIIDDFAQSRVWGDIGHRAIGFFKNACERLTYEVIPAKNFDWSPSRENLAATATPEYLAWKKQKEAKELIAAFSTNAYSISPR